MATFDPIALRIIEDPGTGDTVLDVAVLYSQWKLWVAQSDNSKYPQAFRTVGGDPISPQQNLGSTFFLMNGWRIRPAERSHKLTLVGNIFTDPAGDSVFVPTLGAFTVNTETRVSNLTDSSVARLDLTQLLPAVYIDADRGTAGTAPGVGTPTNPVSNVVDAFAIAARDNLREFRFRGTIELDRDAKDWAFYGLSSEKSDTVVVNGTSVNNSSFESLTLTGVMSGNIDAEKCRLDVVFGLSGTFRRCWLVSSFVIDYGASLSLAECYSEVAGAGDPVCEFSGENVVNVREYSGSIRLSGMSDGCVASVDIDPGHCIADSTCIGGSLLVRGTGRFSNLAPVGSTLVTLSDGLLETWRVKELHQVHGLEAGHPLTVTQTTRAAGEVAQTIAEAPNGTVTITRN